MIHEPYSNLQAMPDFSAFLFNSIGLSGTITRQVRFTGQKDGKIYNLDLRDFPVEKNAGPAEIADNGDMDTILSTLIQIIEVYTERYPRRTIRLVGNTGQKTQLYRSALERHLDIIYPLFVVSLEENVCSSPSDRNINSIAFLLKRKPIPYFTIHTIHTTWSGQSRMFKRKVKIELVKGVRIGVALPQG